MYWRPEPPGQGAAPESKTHLDQPFESEASSPELESLVEDLRADLRSLYGELRRAALAEWRELLSGADQLGARVVLGACYVGFALAAAVAAALFLLRGLHTALQAWSGLEWVADVGTGALVLAVFVVAGFATRRQRGARATRATRAASKRAAR